MTASNQMQVFDRTLLRQRRDKTAAGFAAHSTLLDEMAAQLRERLSDVKRDFTAVLELGRNATAPLFQTEAGSEPFTVISDLSLKRLALQKNGIRLVCDEEFLPFAARSFDLVLSNASLHWVNDLPGSLLQIKNILKADGLFLASLLGGQTLQELRSCLLEAEITVTGGASPRLSPVIDLQTASALMHRAGFALPVADSEMITLTYSSIFELMHDLRGMGEANTHLHRLRKPTRRALFEEAGKLYQQRFATADGHIAASFEVIFLHGWG